MPDIAPTTEWVQHRPHNPELGGRSPQPPERVVPETSYLTESVIARDGLFPSITGWLSSMGLGCHRATLNTGLLWLCASRLAPS